MSGYWKALLLYNAIKNPLTYSDVIYKIYKLFSNNS